MMATRFIHDTIFSKAMSADCGITAMALREMQELAARRKAKIARDRLANAKRMIYPKLSGVGRRECDRRMRQAARAQQG